jgi:hypothetical protein
MGLFNFTLQNLTLAQLDKLEKMLILIGITNPSIIEKIERFESKIIASNDSWHLVIIPDEQYIKYYHQSHIQK